MFERGGRGAIAIGLGVTLAAVLAVSLWAAVYQGSPSSQQQSTAAQDQQIPDLSALPGHPKSYQAICDRPISADQADLCQQWRAAEKAEETAWYAQVQLYISGAGLFGLALTVIYAWKASDAATRATNAAVRSATTAERAFVGERRPWLKILYDPQVILITEEGHSSTVAASITVKNIGQAPAYVISVDVSATIGFRPLNCGPQVRDFVRECVRVERGPEHQYIVLQGDDRVIPHPLPTILVGPEEVSKRYVLVIICVSYRMARLKEIFHVAEGVSFELRELERGSEGLNVALSVNRMYDGISVG